MPMQTLMEIAQAYPWFKPKITKPGDVWVLVQENGTLFRSHHRVAMFRSENAARLWFGRHPSDGRPLETSTSGILEPMTILDYEEVIRNSINKPRGVPNG